jgi:hypothetical protein
LIFFDSFTSHLPLDIEQCEPGAAYPFRNAPNSCQKASRAGTYVERQQRTALPEVP